MKTILTVLSLEVNTSSGRNADMPSEIGKIH
jgi:hypothetical protein